MLAQQLFVVSGLNVFISITATCDTWSRFTGWNQTKSLYELCRPARNPSAHTLTHIPNLTLRYWNSQILNMCCTEAWWEISQQRLRILFLSKQRNWRESNLKGHINSVFMSLWLMCDSGNGRGWRHDTHSSAGEFLLCSGWIYTAAWADLNPEKRPWRENISQSSVNR